MDIPSLFLLMLSLMVMAAMPSTSVALVVVRSARYGVSHGLLVAAGIVLADLLFVSLALFGMAALAQWLGTAFVVVRILAAVWLIGFGVQLIRSRRAVVSNPGNSDKRAGHHGASLLAGLLVTLGDIKAIVFYASLLPVFVDLPALQGAAIAAVLLVTVVAVGSVKVAYALLASRLAAVALPPRYRRPLQLGAGCVMVGAGVGLLVRA
ncbi:LysE family translocator [Alcanivorax sp.]|jgi:threonine/homoserine/homoserine lactone efflux protein|uniref:LysE family translocator n=1 Tax=Alcanivorax sp. TaxID=1872427 RepID=UPI0025BAFC19|nr:LysE family translocator [Alcanivorax sp.]